MEASESTEPPVQAETKENSSTENRKPIGKRLVYKAPPPPTNAAPVSKEVIENVKKRIIVMPKSAPPAAMTAATQGGGFVPKVRNTPLKSEDSEDEKSDDSYEGGRRSYRDRDDHGYKKSLDVSSDYSPNVDEDSYYDDHRKEKGNSIIH